MRRYKDYKDSGIAWMGRIPSHWEVKCLRNFLKFVSVKGYGDKNLLSVTRERGVILRNVESKEENHNFIPDDLKGYKLVKPGQFVINKMKSWQGSYGVSDYEGIVSPAYYVCHLDFPYKEYFSMAIRSRAYVPFFTRYSKGIRVDQWDLSPIGLKSITFAIPPISEQIAITSYLKDKTHKIEQYVAERERERELFESLKQSEIANVVTKGLNPNVPMKDSGIPWIGMIPEHWTTRTLSQMSRVHYISNKEIHHQNLLSLSYGKIVNKDINTTEGLLPASFDGYQIIENGNIVLRLTDLQNDHKSLRVGLATQEGIITSAYLTLQVFNDINPKYLYYLLHSIDIKKVFYSMGNGLRQSLNWAELKKMRCVLPPLSEQQAIVEYIDSKLSKIDQYMADLQAEIDYLKEFKQRLISDAVTGQICVAEPQKGNAQ